LEKIRVGVVGCGVFGRHHMRVIRQSASAELVAVVDTDAGRAAESASQFQCQVLPGIEALRGRADAAIVAVPTIDHVAVGCSLMEQGLDILVEKPIASDLSSAHRLINTAESLGRVLQVGHLERFNPAVLALDKVVHLPLFFEIHRLSTFTPRSLDIDVVLDLMIHDIDIVLALVKRMPDEIRAAGISILTDKIDIANARLAFPGGCVANLTASRVSTERVRKLRLFQPHQYISVDYSRQKAHSIRVTNDRRIAPTAVPTGKDEPLRLELESFFDCLKKRLPPRVSGRDACLALEVALGILDKIKEHSRAVAQSLVSEWKG
jgi:predicted dehydrogenase